MNLFLRTFSVIIPLLFPIITFAMPSPTWEGPPCDDYKVCSVDPPDPNELEHCYTSYSQSYFPSQIELDLVAICQAAKEADIAAPNNRSGDLTRVLGLENELAAEINSDPNDAQPHVGTIGRVSQDMQTLAASMVTYSGSGSDQDWQDVSDNLETLALDAEIIGVSDQ